MNRDSPPERDAGAVTEQPTSVPTSSGERPFGSAGNTGLKLVTVTANQSFPDGALTIVGTGPDRPPPRSTPDPYLGCTIDNRYKVERVLGEGGMGVVYECRHKIIDKKVAMKVLRADMARDKEVTERFLLEARAASSIGHEHIIDISDFGQLPDGSAYFVMEFLDGHPLSEIVQGDEPVPVERILHIAKQLARGLQAAHEADIVHRDLKPDNVYLIKRGTDADFVKILDFGIAKVSSGATGKLTRAGSVFGTPHYMSPEQAAGAAVDHRGDIYSVGVILYELASGKVPFDADNFMGILTQHMYKAPVPIRALVPQPADVPPGLEAIVLKCLSKRPEQRYQSMQLLIDDLNRLSNGQVPEAVSDLMSRSSGFNVPADFFKHSRSQMLVPATPGRSAQARWPVFAGLAAVVLAVGVAAAIFGNSADSPAAEGVSRAEPEAIAPDPPPVASTSEAVVTVSTQVVIAVDPIGAEVFRDGRSLGSSPVVVQVAEGEAISLDVRHSGYAPRTVELDGSEPKMTVVLKKIAKPAAARKAARQPTPKQTESKSKRTGSSPGGSGEIVNPWAR